MGRRCRTSSTSTSWRSSGNALSDQSPAFTRRNSRTKRCASRGENASATPVQNPLPSSRPPSERRAGVGRGEAHAPMASACSPVTNDVGQARDRPRRLSRTGSRTGASAPGIDPNRIDGIHPTFPSPGPDIGRITVPPERSGGVKLRREVTSVKLLDPELRLLEQRVAPDLGIGIGIGVDVSLDGSSDTSSSGSDGSDTSSS